MDEPMIISVAGNQDALWEQDDFWEEKISSENKVSDGGSKTETLLLDKNRPTVKTEKDLDEITVKTESNSFDSNHVKTEPPVRIKNDIKTETVDEEYLKSETSFLNETIELDDEDYLNNHTGTLYDSHDIDSKPQHEVIHEKDISIVDVAFVCGVCKSRFDSEESCKKHIQIEHETPVEEEPPPKPSLKSYRIKRNEDDLKRKSDSPAEAVPEKSPCCDNNSVANNVKPPVVQFTPRVANMTQVLCPTCGARFFHQKTLSRHMQNQHGVRENIHTMTYTALLYACDFCGAKFSRYRTMLDHYKSEHQTTETAPVDMPCLTCDEMFKSYKQLEDHVLSEKHTLQWLCFACDQKFNKDVDFRSHDCLQNSSNEFVQNFKNSHLVCETCSKIYFGPKLFSKHISRCRIKETCKDCCRVFDTMKAWFCHKRDCSDIQVIEVHPFKS